MGECNCCKSKIENTDWKGLDAVRFCAGGYEALVIPGVGANVIELIDNVRGLNLLRVPDNADAFKARPQVFGIPVLFPPNRIEDGTFTAAGRIYNFPINEPAKNNHIHGFLHKRAWNVTRSETSENSAIVELTFDGNKNTDFYQYLPHEFECKLLYTLSEKGLEQKIAVINKSDSAMPLGVGFHTAFKMPFHPDSKGEECLMRVSIGRKWQLDERILPTGNLMSLSPADEALRNQGTAPVGQVLDLMHYTSKPIQLGDREFHGAVIEDPQRTSG